VSFRESKAFRVIGIGFVVIAVGVTATNAAFMVYTGHGADTYTTAKGLSIHYVAVLVLLAAAVAVGLLALAIKAWQFLRSSRQRLGP
jgi:hypothetical protein